MRLLNLHINGFGKFQDQDISFQKGLNVVYGKNEAGKSTLHTFIRGMLFGIEKQRGRAARNDLYGRYEPWAGSGTYEGWLRLESLGEIYRIERRFQKQNKELVIINETLGKEMEPTGALLDQLRCGLTETAYNNTISIGQLKCATDGGMVAELRNYIANLNTSGSIALNITKASTYLKNQRRELEAQLVPQAALSYTTLISEIRKLEQEISSPAYANQLSAYRSRRLNLKQTLEQKQQEKESLLQKAARGRQVLAGSQFTDRDSISSYMADTRSLYEEYQTSLEACSRKTQKLRAILAVLAAVLCLAGAGVLIQFPGIASGLPVTLPLILGGLGSLGFVLLILGFLQINRGRRHKKDLDASTRLLQEIFARHLGDSGVSQEAMSAFELRMGEFLRLCGAITQSEETLHKLSDEIAGLMKLEDSCSDEIEQQQRVQWELEKKLEHLSACKNQSEALKRTLAENERIQEELDAIDLAQETMTTLSTSIRDSFGLYLNKTASQLIGGITGGIYSSMSIDQNLNIYMNTPSRLVPIEQVSSGTMDQIYLAVRLAAAKLVQNGRDSMPLIFDDSFVLYDDDRLKTALKWLVHAYSSQIIVFTCHQREAQLLTANQVEYHLISI